MASTALFYARLFFERKKKKRKKKKKKKNGVPDYLRFFLDDAGLS